MYMLYTVNYNMPYNSCIWMLCAILIALYDRYIPYCCQFIPYFSCIWHIYTILLPVHAIFLLYMTDIYHIVASSCHISPVYDRYIPYCCQFMPYFSCIWQIYTILLPVHAIPLLYMTDMYSDAGSFHPSLWEEERAQRQQIHFDTEGLNEQEVCS